MTKVITKEVRLCFTHLLTPRSDDQDPQNREKDRFQAMILLPKSDTATYEALKAAEAAALADGLDKIWNNKVPGGLLNPDKTLKESVIRDGDEYSDKYPERAGHWFFTPRSKSRPGVVSRDMQEIIDPSEVYSGMYARVSMRAYAFDVGVNKGVSFVLDNVQKLRDGEKFGAVADKPEDDFADSLDDII